MLVVDASVAVKWLIDEPDTDQAISLNRFALISVDLVWSECANTLWRLVRLGKLDADVAKQKYRLLREIGMRFIPTPAIADRALDISIELGHPAYDCLYVAATERERARLVTTDEKLLGKLNASSFAPLAISLQDAAAN